MARRRRHQRVRIVALGDQALRAVGRAFERRAHRPIDQRRNQRETAILQLGKHALGVDRDLGRRRPDQRTYPPWFVAVPGDEARQPGQRTKDERQPIRRLDRGAGAGRRRRRADRLGPSPGPRRRAACRGWWRSEQAWRWSCAHGGRRSACDEARWDANADGRPGQYGPARRSSTKRSPGSQLPLHAGRRRRTRPIATLRPRPHGDTRA